MKLLLKLVGFLLLLVIIAGAGVVYFSDTLVKKGIEKGGETALGVTTRVEDVQLSLLGGEATMKNLNIANPTGFAAPQFLKLGQADFAVSLNSLLSDKVVVPHIEMSGIRVNLEQKDGRNNVNPLLERARQLAGDKDQSAESAAPTGEGGKKYVVTYFSLDDVQVNANLDVLGQSSSLNLVLPKIELHNLGEKEQGLTMPQLIEKILQVILTTAQQSSGQLSPALARMLSGELSDLESLQSNLTGQVQQQTDKLVGDLEKKLQIDVSDEDKKRIEEKTGDLLKGLGDRLEGN